MKPAIEPVIRIRPWPRSFISRATLLQEIDRAGDVGVDDPAHLLEVLVDEGPAKAPPGIGEQRIDRPPARRRQQAVYAVGGGKIGLQRLNLPSGAPEQLGGAHDFRLVSHDQEVVAMGGALLGKLKADAGRGAGHDGKRRRAARLMSLAEERRAEFVVMASAPP
jgi:hypothetical protein